ncbi:MAG: hypothetical protein ACLUNO_04485 [Oscillospiraceae bacterium]
MRRSELLARRSELLQRREELLGQRNIVHERIAQAFPALRAGQDQRPRPSRVCMSMRSAASSWPKP